VAGKMRSPERTTNRQSPQPGPSRDRRATPRRRSAGGVGTTTRGNELSSTNTSVAPSSAARTGELLRLCIAKMGPHASGYEPPSYALWYEYVAGHVPALRTEIDAAIEAGGRLTEEQTQALYEKHVRPRVEKTVVAARTALAT